MIFRILQKAMKMNVKATIFIGLLIFVLLSAKAIQVIEPQTFTSYFSALWWVMTSVTTVGYGDISPVTAGGQLFAMVIVYIVGIGIMGVAVGYVVDVYVEFKNKKESGKLAFKGKDHFVIINYTRRSKETIQELLNMHEDKQIVLIDEDIEKVPFVHEHVHFVHGEPADIHTLEKANIAHSTSVMIFSSDGVPNASFADGQTLLVATSVEDYSRKINKSIYTIVEVTSEKHIASFVHGGVDEFITPNQTSARLIAKSGTYKGISEVFRQLTSSNYGEDIFTITPQPSWETFGDACHSLHKMGATLLSVDNNLDIAAKSSEKLPRQAKLLIVCKSEIYEQIKKSS
ncbi:TrkA family potassium uptake protein [Virgibacillus sp. SK37]|uniref:potassium channel family protein n=1 Tax=Virgibacillus sp. SK37 TaxID=403957 RepID=UPI00059563F6|nr:potassium channel family protein [Virgibacillus sp. SK37]